MSSEQWYDDFYNQFIQEDPLSLDLSGDSSIIPFYDTTSYNPPEGEQADLQQTGQPFLDAGFAEQSQQSGMWDDTEMDLETNMLAPPQDSAEADLVANFSGAGLSLYGVEGLQSMEDLLVGSKVFGNTSGVPLTDLELPAPSNGVAESTDLDLSQTGPIKVIFFLARR
ncbi:MAG: hypothetical protein Q9165_008634 [Trypethelium subeluteriae]